LNRMDAAVNWHWTCSSLHIETPVAHLRLTPLADDLIRMQVTSGDGTESFPTGAVIKDDWPPVVALVEEKEGRIRLCTPRMAVEVELSPIRLSWYEGNRLFARDEAIEVGDGRVVLRRSMPPDEHYYGFGQKEGFLDKRGRRMVMWATDDPLHTPTTDPLYQSIPFFLALRQGKAHGFFLDSGARSIFDMGSLDPASHYCITVYSPNLDAYIFAGPEIGSIIARYTELTGRMELPPLWTLGFHQCRWSYYPAERLRELARSFRQRQIPCDALWLDIDYMDGYRVFTWDKERFPDPAGLLADLRRDGFKVVTIMDPGVKVDPNYTVYQQGVEGDHFIRNPDGSIHHGEVWPGTTAYPDFLKAATRRWWGDLHKALLDVGVAGIWNDMNEPSSFIPNAAGERTLPHDVVQGEEGRKVPHRDVHNLYGFKMCQATYEGLKRHRPEQRPFILTRSGYAGIQRYAAVWMGDNHSWWEHMLEHLSLCMGMGLSGVPFVGADVGGFSANATGELVARWVQLGTFTPFFRMHSAKGTRDQEPWSFGAEVEEICRRFIRLRYRLLPYLYTLFEEASRTGLPILRPLVMEDQADPETWCITDQAMVGSHLLIAPVMQPGATRRMVYLPRGTWYDFWTGQPCEGGRYVIAEAPLERMPVYVRAGTALPMGPEMAYVGEKPADELTVHVYPGKGRFDLYEDEGEGYGYRSGAYARTPLVVEGARLTVGKPEGGWQPPRRQVEVVLHGVAGPVRVDGRPVEAEPVDGGGLRVLVQRPGGFTVEAEGTEA